MKRLNPTGQSIHGLRRQLATAFLALGLAACSVGSFAAEQTSDLERRFMDGWREGKIETIYLLNPHLNGFDIDAEVDGTSLVLTGQVSEDIERDLAEAIARDIEGIASVDNQIIVAPATEQAEAKSGGNETVNSGSVLKQKLQDLTITTLVKGKLLKNPHIKGFDINVDTVNGEVTLQGEVDSGAAKDLAWRLTKNTAGVMAVDNRLVVRAVPEPTES